MNADIITSTTFPHGTAEGFQGGCNTAHCPAEVSCRTVHTRYMGDWAFRRQVNAGITPAEIVAAEEEQAREAARAELKAKRARPGVRAGASREDRRAAANRARSDGLALIPRHTLRELLNAGLTDREIATKLGLNHTEVPEPSTDRVADGVRRALAQHGHRFSLNAADERDLGAIILSTIGSTSEPQGEPSDAPTVQFIASRGGKSQELIDRMLAQANEQGIRVEVVHPQGEPSDAQVVAALTELRGDPEVPTGVRPRLLGGEVLVIRERTDAEPIVLAVLRAAGGVR